MGSIVLLKNRMDVTKLSMLACFLLAIMVFQDSSAVPFSKLMLQQMNKESARPESQQGSIHRIRKRMAMPWGPPSGGGGVVVPVQPPPPPPPPPSVPCQRCGNYYYSDTYDYY